VVIPSLTLDQDELRKLEGRGLNRTASVRESGVFTIHATFVEWTATRHGYGRPQGEAEPSQGWYDSGETGHSHWRYFYFD